MCPIHFYLNSIPYQVAFSVIIILLLKGLTFKKIIHLLQSLSSGAISFNIDHAPLPGLSFDYWINYKLDQKQAQESLAAAMSLTLLLLGCLI